MTEPLGTSIISAYSTTNPPETVARVWSATSPAWAFVIVYDEVIAAFSFRSKMAYPRYVAPIIEKV